MRVPIEERPEPALAITVRKQEASGWPRLEPLFVTRWSRVGPTQAVWADACPTCGAHFNGWRYDQRHIATCKPAKKQGASS